MARYGPATVLLVAALCAACAPKLKYPAKTAAPPPVHQLWQEPEDLSRRDLFYGVGGRQNAPNPRGRYKYQSEDTSGASPGYNVRDDNDVSWDIKLGEEAQPEVVASRLLWAIGYHQPATYYVPYGWTLTDAPNWMERAAGPQGSARFRREPDSQDAIGEWSWYDNPFVGTRAFKGLVMANLILANWDYKTSNNRIYRVKPPVGDASQLFVVRDLGAAFGKETPNLLSRLRLRALRGSKNHIEDFEETGFIRRVNGDRVELEYKGMDPALFENITKADVRWICGLFNRLTDQQWRDAFRAAGYPEDLSERFIRKIKGKISQGAALGN
jgi:hypothetical protein